MKTKNKKKKKFNFTIIVTIVLVLLLVCSFTLYFYLKGYNKITYEDRDLYYYFAAQRINFSAKVKLDADKNIVSISAEGIVFDNTPLYYQNEDKVILPANMEVINPYRSNPMSKLGKNAVLELRYGAVYSDSEVGSGRLTNCFLYDGEDIYFFVDKITLLVNDDSYDLAPMSFVEVNRGYIQIYNNRTEEYKFIEYDNQKVKAYTHDYEITLTDDTVKTDYSYYILMHRVDQLDDHKFDK